MNEDSNLVFYAYGFTQAGLVPAAPGAEAAQPEVCARLAGSGIDQRHPPFFRRQGSVAAIVSQVSRSDFCGPAGDKNLEDLDWLAPRACRHQAVLEEAMRLGPVLPTRFGTLFSSPASLEGFLRKHEAALAGFLERMDARQEWAVKGFLDPARAEGEWLSRRALEQPGPAGATPGLAYLHEQRLRLEARQAVDDRLAQAAEGLFHELNPLASEIVARRILARETANAAREMVLNWALLLPAAAAAEFRGRIERANAQYHPAGLAIEVSGPWPPYSFCPVLQAGPEEE